MLSFKIIILVSLSMGIIETKPPESKFCTNKSPVSCATQLWGQHASSSDECNMWFPGRKTNAEQNDKECVAMKFERGNLATVPTDLGRLKLRTYFGEKNDYTLTAFNVSFTKIKWKELKMRFQPNQNSNRFCREFTIQSPNKTVTQEAELFYDCIWANESIEHKAYNFEYQASDEKSTYLGRYLFNVPKSNNIKPSNKNLSQSELFAYIDVLHLPLLVLYVQTASERFDIGPENYAAFVHHNTTSGVVKSKLEPSTVEDDEISFVFNTNRECGSYYFTVEIVHPNCSEEVCFITRTPTLIVPENPYFNKLIAIAGCGAAVLAVVVFILFLCRRRICALPERAPTVLMIYAQTTKKHIAAVTELAKYLNDFCHVEALIDELHIHKTTTKDPFSWCNDAMDRSDFVMVLSSPFHNCRNYEGVYRNVDALGLKLIREKLSDHKSKQRFLSVVLPYCGVTDLPSEAKNLRRFELMKDFRKLLAFLHTKSTTSYYRQYYVQRILYGYGSKEDVAKDGPALLNAMKLAELELGKKKCDCEQSEDEATPQLDEFVTVNLKESCNDLPMATQRKKRDVTEDMYPGPIIDLDLFGREGDNEGESETKRIRNTKIDSSTAIDINMLDLG